MRDGRARALSPFRREQKGTLIWFRPDKPEPERFVVAEGDHDLEKLGREAEQSVRAFYLKKALEVAAAVVVAAVGIFSDS